MKRVLPYLLLFLIAYVGALFYTLPVASVESWLKQKAKGKLRWEEMALQWDGVQLKQVELVALEREAPVKFEQITVAPQLSALLKGTLAADLNGQLEHLHFNAVVTREAPGVLIAWDADIHSLKPLLNQLVGTALPAIEGEGSATGTMQVAINPLVIQQGQWESTWGQMKAYGVEIDQGSIQGTIENNRIDMDLSARGDVALSGKMTIRAKLQAWKQSPLGGKLEIRPENPSVAQIFPKGRPIAVQMMGTLGEPRWKQ